MAMENTQRSRRALLAAVGGGVAALVAQAIGRPLPAQADGETVKVGREYDTARTRTLLRNQVNDDDVLLARSDAAGTGVRGHSRLAYGVAGRSEFGTGVAGDSPLGIGVHGSSDGGRGVIGESQVGTGVNAGSVAGIGLHVSAGRVRIDQVSGVAVIPEGETSTTIRPGVEISHESFVLLTPRANLHGRDLWTIVNAIDQAFTIQISSPRFRDTHVGWLLLG